MTAEAVVDSNVLFGFRSRSDQWHEPADAIVTSMDAGDLPRGQVTNYALPEVVNSILKAAGYDHAVETIDFLNESAGFRIRHLSQDDFASGLALFR